MTKPGKNLEPFLSDSIIVKLLRVLAVIPILSWPPAASADTAQKQQPSAVSQSSRPGSAKESAKKPRRSRRRAYWYNERTYTDPTAGDFSKGEDPMVREAVVEALGKFNGAVVVADAGNGRILAMVNQKLALASGYVPCSIIKIIVGLAALNEGIVKPGTRVWFEGYWFMTMVEGLAISNNVYFEYLGEKLGFERLKRYANLFGLGEKAGWRIAGEQLGRFPDAESRWSVGRMSTFGDGISVTPLQLAALTGALANGGTLYYLQTPRTEEQIADFSPKVKRQLPIRPWLTEIETGLQEAVKRGTGRKALLAGQLIRGKTGTCTQRRRPYRAHLGWFASYNDGEGKKLAVIVMLRGGPMMYGPRAAEIAGNIYRQLADQGYFTSPPASPPKIIAGGIASCCSP